MDELHVSEHGDELGSVLGGSRLQRLLHRRYGSPAGSGSRGGVRIFDISNPAAPELVADLRCDANQNDPIVWDRNGNGVADLLLVGVDRTMANPNCGAPRSAHDDRNGWEGVRIFTMSDDPANPFATITPVKMQYTDCGAHTITAWTRFADDPVNPRLIVYASSYPLRAGPTCGQANFNNVTNPYDPDKVVNDPLHRQIQVLSVPLNNPAATTEIAAPRISYPGDPDGRMDWTEKGLTGLEPAAVACHDIVVHMEHNLAGGACAEQGQVWDINPATGIPDTENPILVGDGEVSSGGSRPDTGRSRLLPLRDVQQRRNGRELGRRGHRERLPDDDDLPAAAVEPGRRNPQDRADDLHGPGGQLPERVPSWRRAAGSREQTSTALRTWAWPSWVSSATCSSTPGTRAEPM